MDTSGPITILEVLFLLSMLGIAIIIAFGSGLYRAIELQNNITTVVEDLGLVQATIDTIQTVNLAQINFSFDSLRSSVYVKNNPALSGPLSINDWALCTSYPFPNGNPPDHQVDPLGILPPWKNPPLQKIRCDELYAKTLEDLADNNA
jgi:hypothetical protein